MDYTSQRIAFKVAKALRYVRLYGPRRTFAKVEAQYHMKKEFAALPKPRQSFRQGAHIGLIGCGNYQYSTIAYYLRKNYGAVIHAAMDRSIHRAASLFRRYGLNYYTDDAARLIHDPSIDLLFIASNHASHAEYAIRALEQGKHVHIEKPHVVNEDQLLRLCQAMTESDARVALGFNRPGSRIGQAIKAALDSQSGPTMMNWFVAGHEISPDHWYFNQEEGGRVLGNLCHWTDFVYQLIAPENRYPIVITPTRAAKSDCDIAVSYLFGDGSIAVITFSAKGHTFEGVKERFAAHRGNVLIGMDDFQHLVVEDGKSKRRISQLFRDHGHENRIRESYSLASKASTRDRGCTVEYVWESAQLFLKTRQALDENQQLTLYPFHAKEVATGIEGENVRLGKQTQRSKSFAPANDG